ncbi:MAG: hypothetical protein ACFFA0_09250 [Promethearchaeota archaeon]
MSAHNLFWKINSNTIVVVSFVFGSLFFNLENIPAESIDIIVWIFNGIFIFFLSILIIDLIKMGKYLVWRFEVCREIEKELLGEGVETSKLKLATFGNMKREEKWYMKYLSIMCLMPIVIIGLIIGSILIAISLTSI